METRKLTVQQKRDEAQKELLSLALTRGGAQKIAEYFINTVSWSKLMEAYKDLK